MGIYDMYGNVHEYCYLSFRCYQMNLILNPKN